MTPTRNNQIYVTADQRTLQKKIAMYSSRNAKRRDLYLETDLKIIALKHQLQKLGITYGRGY